MLSNLIVESTLDYEIEVRNLKIRILERERRVLEEGKDYIAEFNSLQQAWEHCPYGGLMLRLVMLYFGKRGVCGEYYWKKLMKKLGANYKPYDWYNLIDRDFSKRLADTLRSENWWPRLISRYDDDLICFMPIGWLIRGLLLIAMYLGLFPVVDNKYLKRSK